MLFFVEGNVRCRKIVLSHVCLCNKKLPEKVVCLQASQANSFVTNYDPPQVQSVFLKLKRVEEQETPADTEEEDMPGLTASAQVRDDTLTTPMIVHYFDKAWNLIAQTSILD